MSRQEIHLITPGDHYSPRTGSAIPTVVHGLSRAAQEHRPKVLVGRGTYTDRYGSADIIEYDLARSHRTDRYLDRAATIARFPRPAAYRSFAAALQGQDSWPAAILLAHNAPQAIPQVNARHTPVLYAHNQVLRRYGRREVLRMLEPSAATICVSNWLADETSDLLPAPLRSRVAVVLNGVDVDAFSGPRVPKGEPLRVTFVGRVIPDKGVHVLLEAARLLGRRDVQVSVVGRAGFGPTDPLTPYEKKLRTLARDVPCEVRFVSFLPRPQLAEVLLETDLLVVPSVWPEPFGLTALEGMAAGAAVVASEVGGLPEAVGDAAVLVAPGDADELAAAIDAHRDDATLSRAQHRGRTRAEAMSWESARKQLDDVLSGV